MLAQEAVPRRVDSLVSLGLTRSIWSWLNEKFERVDSRLQKADLLKSAAALFLLAQLISIIQKELPEDSHIKDLLTGHDQDGYQTNLVVWKNEPWKAVHQNCTRPLEVTQHGFFTISLLIGPKPQPDEDPGLTLIEIHIPYSEAIEKWNGQFRAPRLTAAMVTNPDQKYINRPATEDELHLMASLLKSVTFEKV